MSFGHTSKKKENLTVADIAKGETNPEIGKNQGDRWTFAGVSPDSGYIVAAHSGERTQEEAAVFVEKIKTGSDGKAPLFVSDSWFYQAVLTPVCCVLNVADYKGRGRPPKPKKVADPALEYAQVHKERDKNGKIINISTRIVLGNEVAILKKLDEAKRCRSINTDYIESRNGKYRKDPMRVSSARRCATLN